MSLNQAAWLDAEGQPLRLGPAPMPKPGPRQLVIKNQAVAINPADWKIQIAAPFIKNWPMVLGLDIAGTVEEVGEEVTRFKKGQRVISHSQTLRDQVPAKGAFQLYPVADEVFTSVIPDSMSFEQAVVLPVAISTAASGLYIPKYLGLPYLPSPNPKPTGKTLLVWGGASSVGAVTIQLAVASGLKVVTTASPANHEFVKALGASAVFDYRSPSVVEDIVKELQDSDLAGVYDAIAEEPSFEPITEILKRLGRQVKVAAALAREKPSEGFDPLFVFCFEIATAPNEAFGEAIWGKFVPEALASGQLQAKPDPVVVGHGLSALEHGMKVHKAGVSAKKIVVTL
ncbi:zinc-binding oxidoreductase CipB [Aspergillus nomiae NRRL 13137]|uniref:Zinc-binding oxidoreductase CipB n=1 Tax=Aspergillus nomiae NRRL (strain ATCC 15546 / NRRL 13137 / CBS 260.88 / M93) TaxID=1509407 RepID=A0A0L1J6H1_ASPN3|nr:zinc-binding oxidoreductase CipB [Aspergillus nomiae NRRL 13137]KNG87339.1 zinc-binding oxidoreductase CipB [Aspergillus nomiae NRRL 13137]